MTDRERTIYELCRFYEEGLCSSPETPKRTNECIKGECVVFEGYTRQPEPSLDRVEAVAEELFYQDWDEENGYAMANASNGNWAEQTDEIFREHYYKRAREILKLFPVPELKVMDGEAIVNKTRKDIGQWLLHQESTTKNYHEARMTETWRVVNTWHVRALLDGKDPREAKVGHWPMPAHEIPDGYHM